MGSPGAPSLHRLEIDGAALHADRVPRHALTRDGHADARAEVELPAVQGTAQDIALDPAIAEIAALMRALVADREDLVGAPVEDHILTVHRHEGWREERQGGDVEDLGL